MLTVRLAPELDQRLRELAAATGRPKSHHAREAIARYLEDVEDEQRQLEKIREGIADADAGRVIDHEEVGRWLDCWGTEDELPPPECD